MTTCRAWREARTDPPTLVHHPSLSGLSNAVLDAAREARHRREFDLVLHLPLRYEDETRLYSHQRGAAGRAGAGRRHRRRSAASSTARGASWSAQIEDGSGVLVLRFFNFYPSQVKQLAPGTRVRAFGEIRQGFFGAGDGASAISRGARKARRSRTR